MSTMLKHSSSGPANDSLIGYFSSRSGGDYGFLMKWSLSHHAAVVNGADKTSMDSTGYCQICLESAIEKPVTSECPNLQSVQNVINRGSMVPEKGSVSFEYINGYHVRRSGSTHRLMG